MVLLFVVVGEGEDFGRTVGQQSAVAKKALAKAEKQGKSSNAPARLQGLLDRFVPWSHDEQRVKDMRYQLLTALAGTLAEAIRQDAQHAVLMVHEFLTDERSNEAALHEHDRDLHRFMTTVLDCEPLSTSRSPRQLTERPESHRARCAAGGLSHGLRRVDRHG